MLVIGGVFGNEGLPSGRRAAADPGRMALRSGLKRTALVDAKAAETVYFG